MPSALRYCHAPKPAAEGGGASGFRDAILGALRNVDLTKSQGGGPSATILDFTFNEDGTVRQRGPYERGRKRGPWTLYHPSGSLAARGRFEDDRRVGRWELWGPEEAVFEETVFEEAPR